MAARTITVTVTRDQLVKDQKNRSINAQYMKAGGRILSELRAAGIPIVGAIGLFGVEYGTLTMRMDDGLDGDEFVYTFVGEPLPQHLRKNEYTFGNPLPKPTDPEDDEL